MTKIFSWEAYAVARCANQKQKLLLLRQYLERNSDESHPVTTAQLIEYLASADVSAERKSLYDDMEALRSFGVDVNRVREGNRSGWYIGERSFQLPELRLLADSVQSSRFITRKKSLELIGKLENLASVHQARGLRRQVVVKNRVKTMNESIYYLVDDLHAAIDGDRRIRFHYFGYNARGERVLRHDGAWYEASPYALLWDDENYYLIAYDSRAAAIRHYRVDKIADLETLDAGRDGREAFAALDMSAYTSAHFGMFSGTPENIRLECRDTLAGAVIDRFGTDVMLIPSREGYFTVTVPVAVSAPFFGWLCSFGGDMKLIAPESAVEKLREHIRSLAESYQLI